MTVAHRTPLLHRIESRFGAQALASAAAGNKRETKRVQAPAHAGQLTAPVADPPFKKPRRAPASAGDGALPATSRAASPSRASQVTPYGPKRDGREGVPSSLCACKDASDAGELPGTGKTISLPAELEGKLRNFQHIVADAEASLAMSSSRDQRSTETAAASPAAGPKHVAKALQAVLQAVAAGIGAGSSSTTCPANTNLAKVLASAFSRLRTLCAFKPLPNGRLEALWLSTLGLMGQLSSWEEVWSFGLGLVRHLRHLSSGTAAAVSSSTPATGKQAVVAAQPGMLAHASIHTAAALSRLSASCSGGAAHAGSDGQQVVMLPDVAELAAALQLELLAATVGPVAGKLAEEDASRTSPESQQNAEALWGALFRCASWVPGHGRLEEAAAVRRGEHAVPEEQHLARCWTNLAETLPRLWGRRSAKLSEMAAKVACSLRHSRLAAQQQLRICCTLWHFRNLGDRAGGGTSKIRADEARGWIKVVEVALNLAWQLHAPEFEEHRERCHSTLGSEDVEPLGNPEVLVHEALEMLGIGHRAWRAGLRVLLVQHSLSRFRRDDCAWAEAPVAAAVSTAVSAAIGEMRSGVEAGEPLFDSFFCVLRREPPPSRQAAASRVGPEPGGGEPRCDGVVAGALLGEPRPR